MDASEIWRPIELPTRSKYIISSFGNIKRIVDHRGNNNIKPIKPSIFGAGYTRVCLPMTDSSPRDRLVHRLVAIAFIDNPNNYRDVNHIDGNKENNRVDNLEWVTASQNAIHAYRLGLRVKPPKLLEYLQKSMEIVRANICDLETGIYYNSISELAEATGLPYSTTRGRLRKHKAWSTRYSKVQYKLNGRNPNPPPL